MESEPMQIFLYAIKSPETKRHYVRRLNDFFHFVNLSGTLDERSKKFMAKIKRKGNSWALASFMKYITYQKERAERGEIADATVRSYYKPVKLFMEMNDIELQWKKISRGLPKGRKFAADRAPTLEELQKLMEYPDRRIKAILYTMCSSGIRVGAWDYLRWRNVVPITLKEKIVAAKLIVYEGDEEQYFSFISPEAYNELKKWMDFRKSNGEAVLGDSWLMRDIWNTQKFSRGLVTLPKKLQATGIKRLIERALKSQRIRTKLPPGKRRYEFQTDHGFRKFFKTHAEQKMKPINVEVLMNHSTGISDSYYRPNENELLKDYLNAVPELTLSKENRVLNDSEKLRTHGSEIDHLKEEIRKIKLRNEIVEVLRQGILQYSEKNSEKITPLQLAKADFSKSKGLEESVEHILKEHDGDITGLKKRIANGEFTITDV